MRIRLAAVDAVLEKVAIKAWPDRLQSSTFVTVSKLVTNDERTR
jgi:hypothetical protein